jgi:hypothetical protein
VKRISCGGGLVTQCERAVAQVEGWIFGVPAFSASLDQDQKGLSGCSRAAGRRLAAARLGLSRENSLRSGTKIGGEDVSVD